MGGRREKRRETFSGPLWLARTGVWLAVASTTLAACGSAWTLPDRGRGVVRDEEARVAALLESTGAVLGDPGGRCRVRLLGTEGKTSYAWAKCSSKRFGGASMPVRVDGENVDQPEDGAGYADSVRDLFPDGLADEILDGSERLKP